MPSDHADENQQVSRRRLLATSAVGLAGIAGCPSNDTNGTPSGESSSTESNSDGSPSNEFVDTHFASHVPRVPSDVQWNSYNPSNDPSFIGEVIWEPLARYLPETEEFVSILASDWSFEGDQMTITVNDDYTWHNGDPVTADDVATKFKLDTLAGARVADFSPEVQTTDDVTVELTFPREFNETLVTITALETRIDTKHDISEYQDFVEQYDNAANEDEESEVLTELVDWSRDDTIGNGPFEVVDTTEQWCTCEKYSDHPVADELNFAGYDMRTALSVQAVWEALIGGELDATPALNLPEDILAEMPDVQELTRPMGATIGLIFNHDDDIFGQREVRQAVANLVDWGSAAEAAYGHINIEMDNPPVGLHPSQLDTYIGDQISEYNSYDNQDRATEILQNAGFEMNNGTWSDPDGQPLQINMRGPSGENDTMAIAEHVMGQFQEFGFEANLNGEESSVFYGQTLPNTDHQVAFASWATTQSPIPYFWYQRIFTQDTPEWGNYPEEVTVPPFGEPDGTGETVNVRELVTSLSEAASSDEQQNIIQDLAWVYNQDLPSLPIGARLAQAAINTERWEIPPLDDPIMGIPYPPHVLPSVGRLSAIPE